MSERHRPTVSFLTPDIPNQEKVLRIDATTRKGPIDTIPAYRSMDAFCQALAYLRDPVRTDYDYTDRFTYFMEGYLQSQEGDTIIKNNFWLEPATTWPKEFPSTDTTTIVGKLDDQTVMLKHTTEPTDLILIDELIVSGEKYIGHALDTTSGKEKAIRPGFWYMDDLEREVTAINTLANFGYPVAQNVASHQFFLPWVDTITYDWIQGQDFATALNENIANGQVDKALSIATLFGQHVKQVWKPLLEGPLPNSSVYCFPGSGIGDFIYTGNPSPKEAFVQIDVGGLDENASPIGSARYLEEIGRAITDDPDVGNHSRDLIHYINQGYAEG